MPNQNRRNWSERKDLSKEEIERESRILEARLKHLRNIDELMNKALEQPMSELEQFNHLRACSTLYILQLQKTILKGESLKGAVAVPQALEKLAPIIRSKAKLLKDMGVLPADYIESEDDKDMSGQLIRVYFAEQKKEGNNNG